jgi:transposase InsO family protein
VAEKLAEDWSPGQISGHLAKVYDPGSGMRVSHETIYRFLFIQARGVLAKELQKHLRSGRPTRRNIHNTVTGPMAFTDQGSSLDQRAACRGRRPRGTRDLNEVERAVFQWVAWYNSKRLHFALDYMPPDEYEQAHWARLEEVPQTA